VMYSELQFLYCNLEKIDLQSIFDTFIAQIGPSQVLAFFTQLALRHGGHIDVSWISNDNQ
jgi:hypothetical protein